LNPALSISASVDHCIITLLNLGVAVKEDKLMSVGGADVVVVVCCTVVVVVLSQTTSQVP
jgi:hypothetical protein